MLRTKRDELAALLTMVAITSGVTAAAACDNDAHKASVGEKGPMFVAEKTTGSAKGAESACGKGSCGTDKKGAAAAKKKHAKKAQSNEKKAGDEKTASKAESK